MSTDIVKAETPEIELVNEYFNLLKEEDFRTHCEQWQFLQGEKEDFAKKAAESLMAQAVILRKVMQGHGERGFLAFCEGMGISRRTGYTYLRIEENKDQDMLQLLTLLSITKTRELLPLTKSAGVSISRDGICLPNGTVISIEELQGMTGKQVAELVSEYLRMEKCLVAANEKLTDREQTHKEQMKTLQSQLAKMKNQMSSRDMFSFRTCMNDAENLRDGMLRMIEMAISLVGDKKEIEHMNRVETLVLETTSAGNKLVGKICTQKD